MKALALISGGIDSPVAAYIFLKKNFDIAALIFDNQPFSSEKELQNAINTVKDLEAHGKKINIYVVPHAFVQEKFLNNVNEEEAKYSCIFSRRFMLKTAEKLAGKLGANFLITGDSLGQVASQTLANLAVIDMAVKIPVLRPLIGMDKEEIVKIAKEIGTYENSIAGGITCAAFVDYPVTKADIKEVESIEERFDIDYLIKTCLSKMRVIR